MSGFNPNGESGVSAELETQLPGAHPTTIGARLLSASGEESRSILGRKVPLVKTGWFKSDHSNGTNCLETRWNKSSYSYANGSCAEARQAGFVQVRDSKDPEGPVLSVTPAAWVRFLTQLR